jgi:shikimate 5-dehydrogenase
MTGLDMFIYQALSSIDLWLGEGATNKVNFEELKRHIENYLC